MPETPMTPEPTLVPNLDQKEKAKMDYQAELKWKEILWDKAITGLSTAIFVVAIGSFVGYFTNKKLEAWHQADAIALEATRQQNAIDLEKSRQLEARQHFIAEKRSEAMLKLAPALNALQSAFFDVSKKKPEDLKAVDAKALLAPYKSAFDKAYGIATDNAFLFDEGFRKDTERYTIIYGQIGELPPAEWAKYAPMIGNLGVEADRLAFSALLNPLTPPEDRLPIEGISAAERHELGPKRYVDRQFEYWKSHHKDR